MTAGCWAARLAAPAAAACKQCNILAKIEANVAGVDD